MKYLKFLAFVILSIIAAGCATPNVNEDFTLDSAQNGGLVISSITFNGSYSGYKVVYREINNKSNGIFQAGEGLMFIPLKEKSDFGSAAYGKLIAAALPAGDYEAYLWEVHSGVAIVSSNNSFSIKFHVEPGKTVYLGNFNLVQTSDFGLTVTGANLTLKSESVRDLAVFRGKYPKLAATEVVRSIPDNTVLRNLGNNDSVDFDIPVFVAK